MLEGRRFTMMLLAICFAVQGVLAQNADHTAKRMLDEMYEHYQAASAVQADFDLVLELAESEKEVQKGTMIQKGDQYKVELESYTVYNNGVDMWMYLAEANECQWTNSTDGEESEVPNLNDILSMYTSGEFDYRLVDDGSVAGTAKKIEFKPVDPDSEYFKMILILDTAKKAPRSIKFFHKDGSRYTIDISSIAFDKVFPDDAFTFDTADYPGVHVEDLRLD